MAQTTAPGPRAILVELFTSEGCSSCPPADAWLQQIDKSQPVPGARLVVLSEHVDYWDHDGWKDPYSLALVTQRQEEYARELKLSSPYTPQIVVDGTDNLRANEVHAVERAFQQASTQPKIAVQIGAPVVDAKAPGKLRTHIEADAGAASADADVYAVVALDHVQSQVASGENGGRRLTHVAVVQSLVRVGKMKGSRFSGDFDLKLKPGADLKNTRLVVFVQESGPGKVLGAAERVGIE